MEDGFFSTQTGEPFWLFSNTQILPPKYGCAILNRLNPILKEASLKKNYRLLNFYLFLYAHPALF